MNRRTFAGALLACTATRAASLTLRVRVQGTIRNIGIEDYTAGVLTGESSVFHADEALKAMAVAIRTYAMHFRDRHGAEGFDLCDTTHCQRYESAPPTGRVVRAAQLTAGEILLDRGKPALVYYTLDCGGRTEDVREAWPGESSPYLASHTDPHCQRSAKSHWHWDMSASELLVALHRAGLQAPTELNRITITKRTASHRAQTLTLAGRNQSIRMSASSLRFAVGRAFGFQTIRSDLYEVGTSGGRIVFNGTGSGHGVGLCQRGADQMGLAGSSYRQILAFYLQGIVPGSSSTDALNWRRVSGERVALLTTQPEQDADVLTHAERLLRAAEVRTQFAAPNNMVLRVYPTVAHFIERTGEPGWIAAHAEGTEIHLQPRRILEERRVLESTLRHELTHVLVDARAHAGLPVWFLEGLVEHLSSTGAGLISAGAATDRDLRQTASEVRARAAYADARSRVSALVQRYGETAVLGWLVKGLPRELTNASSKPAATKSK